MLSVINRPTVLSQVGLKFQPSIAETILITIWRRDIQDEFLRIICMFSLNYGLDNGGSICGEPPRTPLYKYFHFPVKRQMKLFCKDLVIIGIPFCLIREIKL